MEVFMHMLAFLSPRKNQYLTDPFYTCHFCQKRHYSSFLLILIMITGSINRLANLTLRSLRYFSPTVSQFEAFKEHMQNIDDQSSMREAAQLLAALENKQHQLSQSIIQLQSEIQSHSQEHPLAVELVSRSKQMQLEIDRQLLENQEIEARSAREIELAKTYGIAKVAKEVIETADYIRQAIRAQELSGQSQSELASLKKLEGQLATLLRKYGIVQFSPLREAFDPNQHQSIGQLPCSDPALTNNVAEVKRTGFKIGGRLLRSAYVLIYG